MSRRWERLVVALGVCLPVPLFAATGLSLPLPAPVERIAAALVPWAEAATLDANQVLARAHGSIVLAPGERPANQSGQPDMTSPGIAESRSQGSGSARADGGGGGRGGGRPTTSEKDEGKGRDQPDAGTTGEEPRPDSRGEEPKPDGSGEVPRPPQPGGESPSGEPGPVEDTVNQVGEASRPVVDEVESTVDDVVEGDVGGTVDELVPGLGK